MDYSQEPLKKIMKFGSIRGEIKPPQHIETVMSNVFIFESNVYKVYKNDNDFFNREFRDLSDKSNRFSFTRNDFEWNQTISPAIYTELLGVSVREHSLDVSEPNNEAEELVIAMNRIRNEDILFERLFRDAISSGDAFEIGKQLAENLAKVRVTPVLGFDLFEGMKDRIDDLRKWLPSVSEVSREEAAQYCEWLDTFRLKHREWFKGALSNEIAFSGDIHSMNVVYSDGRVSLIDTFPPKVEWMYDHELDPMYRVGADFWALGNGRGLFESFVRGYEAGSKKKADRALDNFFILYAASIMVSFLYNLSRSDITKKPAAERYHQFIHEAYKRATRQ